MFFRIKTSIKYFFFFAVVLGFLIFSKSENEEIIIKLSALLVVLGTVFLLKFLIIFKRGVFILPFQFYGWDDIENIEIRRDEIGDFLYLKKKKFPYRGKIPLYTSKKNELIQILCEKINCEKSCLLSYKSSLDKEVYIFGKCYFCWSKYIFT